MLEVLHLVFETALCFLWHEWNLFLIPHIYDGTIRRQFHGEAIA